MAQKSILSKQQKSIISKKKKILPYPSNTSCFSFVGSILFQRRLLHSKPLIIINNSLASFGTSSMLSIINKIQEKKIILQDIFFTKMIMDDKHLSFQRVLNSMRFFYRIYTILRAGF